MGLQKLLIMLFAMVVLPFSVQAGSTFATDPCDPQYYQSLEARAWLEAQREITQNQNLIFKNDSVLEYTCFYNYMRELVAHAPDMFSETTRWGTTPPTDMADALDNLVISAHDTYDSSNFDHNLLGGRASFAYPVPASVTGGSYSCDIMQRVWTVAKCMDFVDDPAHDGFFTFAEYAGGLEPRFLPTACSSSPDYSGNIDLAVVNASTPWTEHNVITYYGLIYPATATDCEPTLGGAVARIQTGLEITVTAGGTVPRYNEYVCTVPGCYYEPTGVNTGSCTR